MSVVTQLYLSQFTFNSVTFSSTVGGPIEMIINDNAQEVTDRTGASKFATFVAVTDIDPVVFIKIRDIANLPSRGANSDLVGTVTDGTNTKTITMKTMTYVGQEYNLIRANPGEVVLKFVHQSADGTTEWLTVA